MEKDELTGKIIGCAIAVHKQLGCGFQEVIYQRALAKEMNKADLKFSREIEMPIVYEDVMVELKAIKELDDLQLVQALNYLRVYKVKRGLLLNFGNTKLEIKRVSL